MIIDIDARICKGCALCQYYCPKDVFAFGNGHNEKGYAVVKVVNLDACTGCRLCEIGCPDLAIFIREE